MAIYSILLFFIMLAFGGIAVDVMRYETRRVALVQTLDRAMLAAASITQQRAPAVVAEDWFNKAGLADELTHDYSVPVITADFNAGQRRVRANAEVRSYNFFMGLMNVAWLEGPAVSEAAQGVSQIEVMMVLDITGSMNDPASSGNSKKIDDLRLYAQEFVDIVKGNDRRNGVSIGLVPYASQVNIPANLRQQFTVTNLSSWNGVADQGVPNINCIEIPTSTYTSVGLSRTAPMKMAAVADTNSGSTNTDEYRNPGAPQAGGRYCTTTPDKSSTPYNDELVNHVFLPTKDGDAVKTRISRLVADGTTSIALGMRWGTALIDESARPIYTAIGDSTVQGRPADNSSTITRKIIILMTDGAHVSSNYIFDAYKTGPSPIWRGSDGKYAIRYTSTGGARTNGTRPNCAGNRTYFVPHLQDDEDCENAAWVSTPTWSGSGTVTQLDWSEVWRYLRVSWVARQLYMRSNVSGTGDYDTIMDMFRGTYLSATTMNRLLQQNCTAAKQAGIEIYGIAFAAPSSGQTQIQNCSTNTTNYYFDAQNGNDLRSAFQIIATDISDLRLTQ